MSRRRVRRLRPRRRRRVRNATQGKSAEEMAKIADGICAQRAGSVLLATINREEQPPKAKAEFDRAKQTVATGKTPRIRTQRLPCQLTEAPARYCSRTLRQKITAGVIDYVEGIENTNMSLRMFFAARTRSASISRAGESIRTESARSRPTRA